MTDNKILQDTYDILEARGWCQHANTRDGKVCLEGAFRAAIGMGVHDFDILDRRPEAGEAWTRLLRTVGREMPYDLDDLGYPIGSPYEWNDEPGRSVEDVKLLLKKAIHDD